MRQDEAGESLVELIVAMAILGTVMVTIVGGFLNLARLSGRQRDQGVAFITLTAGSEYATNRTCVPAGTCVAETSVPSSSVPHDAATTVRVSAPSSTTLGGGTALTQFVVTVITGGTTFTNTVVVR